MAMTGSMHPARGGVWADLDDEVGHEAGRLVLVQLVVCLAEQPEQLLHVLQGLVQHGRVRVKEAQGEPLEDEVQVAQLLFPARLQALQHNSLLTS